MKTKTVSHGCADPKNGKGMLVGREALEKNVSASVVCEAVCRPLDTDRLIVLYRFGAIIPTAVHAV